jgi:hypothetical protein
MTPFEDLIQDLSRVMNIDLFLDAKQSCTLSFLPEELSVQIDLDPDGDRILIGTQLGRITPGSYRQHIFTQAMRANGCAPNPRGILAFSEKNDTLILFQYLQLPSLTGEKLHEFLQLFRVHAQLWKDALASGNIPQIPEVTVQGSGMFGLRT